MLTVGPCESLCFVTWRICLLGICHNFTFQKGQGKAGDVCVLRVLRQVPGQHWGFSVLFGEAEGLCRGVSVLEAALSQTGLDFSSSGKAFGFLSSPDS